MKLGKNQTALLLIIEQCTREVRETGVYTGRAFAFEESITYTRVDGTIDTFFMMTRDLKSLARLAELGLIKEHGSDKSCHVYYTITDSGRAMVARLRDAASVSR